MGVTRGGRGVRLPPLEFELSFICIGFCLINDVRARGSPPPGKGAPPLENFLVTPMLGFKISTTPMGNFHKSMLDGLMLNLSF